MRLRQIQLILWSAAALAAAFWLASNPTLPQGPEIATVTAPLRLPTTTEGSPVILPSGATPPTLRIPAVLSSAAAPDPAAAAVQTPLLPPWTAVIAPGDTFDGLLRRAGLSADLRQVFTRAMQTQYDLAALRPGDEVAVFSFANGRPYEVILSVASGEQMLVRLENEAVAETVAPELETREVAATVTVDGSIFATLERAGVPASLAVDLAQVLGGTVDFRRDLRGGETLRLLWRETRLPDGTATGIPQLVYAELGLEGDRFETVQAGDESGSTSVFRNGERLRTFSPPVAGGRLTSVFGRRRHPIYGDIRMHKGVDYAAQRGTPVVATGPGRISFVGWRNGYGRVVEIEHGPSMTSMYTHLDSFVNGLGVGNRVDAGDRIGSVGSSGLATGPNMHYEIRLNGRPVDPMGEERLATLIEDRSVTEALRRLINARRQFPDRAVPEASTDAGLTPATRGDAT